MTNLDYLYYGAESSGDKEVMEQLDSLHAALMKLWSAHPNIEGQTVEVNADTLRQLLTAWRGLIS